MIIPKREEIKKRREALGLTKYELSKKAGLPANALMRLERGNEKDGMTTHPVRAKAIAEALGCSIEDVFICK